MTMMPAAAADRRSNEATSAIAIANHASATKTSSCHAQAKAANSAAAIRRPDRSARIAAKKSTMAALTGCQP
jgi:hypothetical protein